MEYDVARPNATRPPEVDEPHPKCRLTPTKGTCLLSHTRAICGAPGVRTGSCLRQQTPTGPLDILWRASCQAIGLHEATLFRFIPRCRPAAASISVPCVCVCVLAQMPVISPFHRLWLFFPPCAKKEKRECRENSRRYYCAACMMPSFHLRVLRC